MNPQIMAGIRQGPDQAYADMKISCGPPVEKNFCGRCTRCVEACPAKALTGRAWYPGIPREELLDVRPCDRWKKENHFQYHQGHICGICSAICPFGLSVLKEDLSRSLS